MEDEQNKKSSYSKFLDALHSVTNPSAGFPLRIFSVSAYPTSILKLIKKHRAVTVPVFFYCRKSKRSHRKQGGKSEL